VNGVQHIADATAANAKLDLKSAYDDAAGRTGASTVGTELGGTTLVPGIYNSAAGTFGITGTLTLDGAGVYIFQAASTLITASGSSIILTNGAQASDVFWQVGSSATLGTYSTFKGTIMAQASITVTTGVTIDGKALAQDGAVTLDTDTITTSCSTPTAVPTAVPTVTPAPGQTIVNLGSAANFAILAGSTITNTGDTVVTGDVGLSPGTSITGFPPGIVNGAQYIADAASANAKLGLTNAYNDAAGRTGATTVGTELGGTMLIPGLYNSAAGNFGITGTLTLDAQGDANAVFIFQAASTLITASSSTIVLINGAQAQNVFWQVGSSATLGTYSTFKGTIMARASITVTTGVTIDGKALAQVEAVTLDTNTITKQ
jgi:hypothetical protein